MNLKDSSSPSLLVCYTRTGIHPCKAKRQYLLTLQVRRYCLLALQSSRHLMVKAFQPRCCQLALWQVMVTQTDSLFIETLIQIDIKQRWQCHQIGGKVNLLGVIALPVVNILVVCCTKLQYSDNSCFTHTVVIRVWFTDSSFSAVVARRIRISFVYKNSQLNWG